MAKKRSSSQQSWIRRQQADPYVKQAKRMGYPSRAVHKLVEIQEKEHLFHRGMNVLDLGSSPGSWSKIVAQWVGDQGVVFALDILPMPVPAGVQFIQGDFTDTQVYERLLIATKETPLDLVISDMAPNMSGVRAVDQPKSMLLAELALDICSKTLKKNGGFVVKVFQGEGFEPFVAQVREQFSSIKIRKPKSSRKSSREQYLVAKGYHLT